MNTCFKGKGLKKLRFTDYTADNITYAFPKNGKTEESGVSVVN